MCYSFISCTPHEFKINQALKQAGNNADELKAVINHYKHIDKNEEKLKAAYFLIENMPGHYSSINKAQTKIDILVDSIKSGRYEDFRYHFKRLLKNIKDSTNWDVAEQKVMDIETIDAEFIIENIDLAFEAKGKISKFIEVPWNDFCEYVLPYRCNNEPIARNTRRRLYEEYHWIYDSLNSNISLAQNVDKILKEYDFTYDKEIYHEYPGVFKISQIESIKSGLCSEGVNYKINALRAVGIPCAADYIIQWAANYRHGHEWMIIKYDSTFITCDDKEIKDMVKVYSQESLPKVYRRCFSIKDRILGSYNLIDVTADYKETVHVDMNTIMNGERNPSKGYLCISGAPINKKYTVVDELEIKKGRFHSKNIGTQVLYFPMIAEYGNLFPINFPFYVRKNKEIIVLKPDKNKYVSANLLRKFPLYSSRNMSKLTWINSLNDCLIEGANRRDFSDTETIGVVKKQNSMQKRKVPVNSNRSFRFLRIRSDKEKLQLATLDIYNNRNDIIMGKGFSNNKQKESEIVKLFDSDPLSYISLDSVDTFIGIELPYKSRISYINIQPRNDDNHINEDEKYELYYWDKQWISLGKKTALDTVLIYNNVPKNALLFLRNLTKGTEENVFFLDNNGNQVWPGQFLDVGQKDNHNQLVQ